MTAKQSKLNKIAKICQIIMFSLIVPFVLLMVFGIAINFSAKANNEVPTFLGMSVISVKDDAMLPDYKKGDSIVVKQIDAKEFNVGDNVAYYEYVGEDDEETSYSKVLFSKIVEIRTQDIPNDENNGKLFFRLQGTNQQETEQVWIMQDYLLGIEDGHNSALASLYMLACSGAGIIIFVVLPAVILMALAGVVLFVHVKEQKAKKQQGKDAIVQAKDEQKPEAKDKTNVAKEQKPEELNKKDTQNKEKPVKQTAEKPETQEKAKKLDKEPKVVQDKKQTTEKPAEGKKVEEKTALKKEVEAKAVEEKPSETAPKAPPAPPKTPPKAPTEQKTEPESKPAAPKASPAAPKAPPKAPPAPPKAAAEPKAKPEPPKAPPAPPKAPPKKPE